MFSYYQYGHSWANMVLVVPNNEVSPLLAIKKYLIQYRTRAKLWCVLVVSDISRNILLHKDTKISNFLFRSLKNKLIHGASFYSTAFFIYMYVFRGNITLNLFLLDSCQRWDLDSGVLNTGKIQRIGTTSINSL